MNKLFIYLSLIMSIQYSNYGWSHPNQIKIPSEDSIASVKIIVDFYSWYCKAIQGDSTNVFQPKFAKGKNGMSTLDFSKYSLYLKNNGFTEKFVKQAVKSFTPCLDNLNKIPYDKLKSFDCVDKYFDINCGFFDSYQWIGNSMDFPDGVEVIKIISLENNSGLMEYIKFYNFTEEGSKFYWDFVKGVVILRKENFIWKIDDIQFQ